MILLNLIPATLRVIFTLIVILFSASAASSQTVNGTVVDERYFPVGRVTVEIEGQGTTATDTNGNFSIPVTKKPYNLTIVDQSSAISVRYEGLTTMEPELKLFGLKSAKYANTEDLKVTFPEIPSGTSAIIKFISQDLFYSTEAVATTGETTKIITVDWPKSKEFVSGFVIYISKTQDNYVRYSEYPVTIFRGSNVLQSADLKFPGTTKNPGSSTITVFLPNYVYSNKGYAVYADFLGLNRNASILLSSAEADIQSTKVLVPQNLPFAFRLKVSGNGYDKNGAGFTNYSYTSPNSVINLENEDPPEILAPQDKLYGVSGNTRFSYETGSGTGVYVAHFHSFYPEGDFYVVTRDRNITSPISHSKGMISGNEYQWYVMKHMTYFNVDDFVKPLNFQNDMGYRAVSYSEKRVFRTGF